MKHEKAQSIHVDAGLATRIVSAILGRSLNVIATRPLHGGMVNAVYEWTTGVIWGHHLT